MSRGHFCLGATVALAVLVTSAPGFAQEARSTVSGTITDPSGSAIAGAQLHLDQHRDRGYAVGNL